MTAMMETSMVASQHYLNNCKKIFHKFLELEKNVYDVSLVGDDGAFIKCHQFVLAACSPLLEKVFENYNKNKTTQNNAEVVLLLGAHKSKHIQSIVDYIYHGNLPDVGSINDFDRVVSQNSTP